MTEVRKRRRKYTLNIAIKIFAIIGISHLIIDVIWFGIYAIKWISEHVIIR